MKALRDWTIPIRTMQDNFPKNFSSTSLGKTSMANQLRTLGIVVTPNAGAESLLLQQQLVAMNRVLTYTSAANVNNVLANIELLAFGCVWFAHEKWSVADETAALKLIMLKWVAGLRDHCSDLT